MYGKYKGVGYITYAFMQHHQYTKSYHRCVSNARGHVRKHTVSRGRQSGFTPFEDAPPPIFSREPYPPLASQDSVSVLRSVVCSNSLTQPPELPCCKLAHTRCCTRCGKLARTRCGVEWVSSIRGGRTKGAWQLKRGGGGGK